MKNLILILLLIALAIVGCNKTSSYKEDVTEENIQEEPHPTVQRTIEGITLGMSENELKNTIRIEKWGRKDIDSYREPETDIWDKRITNYNRHHEQGNLTIDRIVCFNGKVVQIVLYIENYSYVEDILNNLKEKYPLKKSSDQTIISDIFNLHETYSYSDGVTQVTYNPNWRYSWKSSNYPRIVYTEVEYYNTLENEKKQEEQSKLNEINENSRNL